jgi:hypothetical protein
MSNTYITQHPFFDSATFVMEFATCFHDYGLRRESRQKLFMPKTEAAIERTVSR